jgi:hypothetical protein
MVKNEEYLKNPTMTFVVERFIACGFRVASQVARRDKSLHYESH